MSAPKTPRPRSFIPLSNDLIGTLVAGKYRLLRAVGHGGMGTVFKAENITIGKTVAVKVLHRSLADDGVAIARFQREARATVAVGHANIVEVLDMGQEPSGTPFIVMEYVRGKNLKALLNQEGMLSPQRAARIAGQLLDALASTHARGIVHRDLKPENILLTRTRDEPEFVKVFDFGIATFTEAMAESQMAVDLTPTGFTMATPFYASPEQIRGAKGRDPRVDIYAMGVILYEMLTAKRPYDAENFGVLAAMILDGNIRPISQVRDDVAEGLEDIVRRALAPRALDRFQTATDMEWALVPYGARPPQEDEVEPTDTFTIDLRELRAREGLVRSTLPAARSETPSSVGAYANVARNELVKGLIEHFEVTFGRRETGLVLLEIGPSAQRDVSLRDQEGEWCPVESLAAALDALDRRFGQGDRTEVADAGRYFVREHYCTGERVEMFDNITPELFFSMVSDLWSRYFNIGEPRVVKVGRGYGRMDVADVSTPYLANSVVMLGIIDGGLRLSGAFEVNVRLSQTAALDGERDVFEATWSAH